LDLAGHRVDEDVHQGVDLKDGPVPVFRRKGIQREPLHPDLGRGLGDSAHGIHAGAVPEHARLAVFLGPAPVAVHYDSYVPGDPGQVDRVLHGTHEEAKSTQFWRVGPPYAIWPAGTKPRSLEAVSGKKRTPLRITGEGFCWTLGKDSSCAAQN